MNRILRIFSLIGLAALGASCGEIIETRQIDRSSEDAFYDAEGDDYTPLEGNDSRGRLATPRGKVTFEHMTNEGEIITSQWDKITLWYYGQTQPAPGENSRYAKPKYTIAHPANLRSYVRKSMSTGYYMLQLDSSPLFQVINVAAGSDGLFVFNENNASSPLFAGYYPSYGKLKFIFGSNKVTKKGPAVSSKAQAFLTLTQDQNAVQFWLYNDVTTGTTTKSLFFFVPTGTYAASWYGQSITGDSDTHTYPTRTGPAVVAPGKVYPTLKLAYN